MNVFQNDGQYLANPQPIFKFHSDSDSEPEPDQDPLALPEEVTEYVPDVKPSLLGETEPEMILVDGKNDNDGDENKWKIIAVKSLEVVNKEEPENVNVSIHPPPSSSSSSSSSSSVPTKNRSNHPCPKTDCEHVSKNLSDLTVHLKKVHPRYKPEIKALAAIAIPNFDCPVCSLKCKSDTELEGHLKSLHASCRPYSCSLCAGKSFALKRHLVSHLNYHLSAASHVCPKCPKVFKKRSHLNVHIRSHSTAQQKNDQCDKSFVVPKSLLKKIHNQSQAKKTGSSGAETGEDSHKYKCDFCPISFSTRFCWARHKLKHEENTDILCCHCGHQFDNAETLSLHKKQRHWKKEKNTKERREESHVCHVCGKKLKTIKSLGTHMERHDGDPCICDECGKPCRTKGDLKFHKLTHLKEKPFQCPFCPWKYTHPSSIFYHMQRDHTHSSGEGFIESELALSSVPLEERTFVCEENNCQEKFTSASCLKQHGLYHKGVRNTPCKKCEEKFICKYDVYNHSTKVHRKDSTDLKCEHCGKEFSARINLDIHVRYNHTGETPFDCSQCERKFKSKADLSYHMVAVHTRNYPFSCEFCEKKFVTRGNLNAHMRVHTNLNDFHCRESGCEKSFKAFNLLKKHLVKEHGKKDCDVVVKRRRKNADAYGAIKSKKIITEDCVDS